MLRRLSLALFALLAFPLTLIAQAVPAMEGGANVPLCILLGPVITAAIQPFKNIPFIKNNTFLLSVIASTVLSLSPQLGPGAGASIGTVIACILATLGGATATHRALIKPVEKKGLANDPQHRAIDLMERYLVPMIANDIPTDPPTPIRAPKPRRRS